MFVEIQRILYDEFLESGQTTMLQWGIILLWSNT